MKLDSQWLMFLWPHHCKPRPQDHTYCLEGFGPRLPSYTPVRNRLHPPPTCLSANEGWSDVEGGVVGLGDPVLVQSDQVLYTLQKSLLVKFLGKKKLVRKLSLAHPHLSQRSASVKNEAFFGCAESAYYHLIKSHCRKSLRKS